MNDTLHFRSPDEMSQAEILTKKVEGLANALGGVAELLARMTREVDALRTEVRSMAAAEGAAVTAAARPAYDYLTDLEQALEEAKRVRTLLGAAMRVRP